MAWLGKLFTSIALIIGSMFGGHAASAPPPAPPTIPVPSSAGLNASTSVGSSATSHAAQGNSGAKTKAASHVAQSEADILMNQIGCTNPGSCAAICVVEGFPDACRKLRALTDTGGGNYGTGVVSQGQTYGADAVVTASPVDLGEIQQVSKYRSCFGHTYVSNDTDGIPELDRSMKHYFQSTPAFTGVDKTKEMAPFDGTVTAINGALDAPFGSQVVVAASADPSETVVFFHLDPSAGITEGVAVKAGQVLGYTDPPDGATFDIAFGWNASAAHPIPQALDSIFNHMAADVLAQYAAKGLTPENIVISKAARDAATCNYPPNGGIGSPLGGSADNWVVLK